MWLLMYNFYVCAHGYLCIMCTSAHTHAWGSVLGLDRFRQPQSPRTLPFRLLHRGQVRSPSRTHAPASLTQVPQVTLALSCPNDPHLLL